MQLTRSQLENLESALLDMSAPEFDFEIREDYSGRFMFNKTCIGFVTNSPLELHGAICALLAEDAANCLNEGFEPDYDVEWFSLRPQMDSMGLSRILYYPNLSVA